MYECIHVHNNPNKPSVTFLDTQAHCIVKLCGHCLTRHMITNHRSWKSKRHKVISIKNKSQVIQDVNTPEIISV